jgi:E3 SUMO-protein ligase PIAS1
MNLVRFDDLLESTSSTDRKQQTLNFTLTSEQTMKLNSTAYVFLSGLDAVSLTHYSSTKFQLRLYCTSNTFYASGFRPTTALCPIEFPPTCEVRVNGVQLTANLKGLKKKPGTAPPADLGRTVRMTGQNRVEMVYVNSQQPIQPKVGESVIYTQFVLVSPAEILSDRHACRSHNCRAARGQA